MFILTGSKIKPAINVKVAKSAAVHQKKKKERNELRSREAGFKPE